MAKKPMKPIMDNDADDMKNIMNKAPKPAPKGKPMKKAFGRGK
jgi:hypothetical protein